MEITTITSRFNLVDHDVRLGGGGAELDQDPTERKVGVSNLEERKAEIRRRIERKARYLETLENMPDFDTPLTGTVLGLAVTYGPSPSVSVIAYKSGGYWFATGENPQQGHRRRPGRPGRRAAAVTSGWPRSSRSSRRRPSRCSTSGRPCSPPCAGARSDGRAQGVLF